jgi:hypothetical protein
MLDLPQADVVLHAEVDALAQERHYIWRNIAVADRRSRHPGRMRSPGRTIPGERLVEIRRAIFQLVDINEVVIVALVHPHRGRIVRSGDGVGGAAQDAPIDGTSRRRQSRLHGISSSNGSEVRKHDYMLTSRL